MAQIYFHCSSAEVVLLDRRGSDVEDLTEARERAVGVAQRFISRPGPEDWREWILHVSDGDGEEIFEMPFSSLLGRPHYFNCREWINRVLLTHAGKRCHDNIAPVADMD